ncbi:MAG: carboxylesterase family protein [Verrucomicrobia bacterium]|nr:carboxylesterase family protein [Verrucomicrobiota bacterium]MBV8486609.1 carboxylesterase family protein [Verrucomicrobiota bacterium]
MRLSPEIRFLLTLLGFALATLGQASVASGSPSLPKATVESGELEGTYFGSDNEAAFLGVPYAAPPVGELRWKPPRPVSKWTGTREANQFGPAAPQLPSGWLPHVAWNEDCLYLNIWTAALSPNAKLPVIVFFHGGGNDVGYSQSTPLGPPLSRLGVVVVSVNYRLGPFGFFAHPALTAESEHHSSGNYGLLDQLLALRWVRDNISRFGGDSNRVTVMGQSAGALDITLLMASPLAAGLFEGAILESGEAQSTLNQDIRSPIPYNRISSTGEASGQKFVDDLGIAGGPDTLERLRSIPADKILAAWQQDREVKFGAIVDGWVVPEQPAKTFAEGKQLRIPVLVGSNADEATVFGLIAPKTVDEYKTYLERDTGRFADQEFAAYPVGSDAAIPEQFLKYHNDLFSYGAYSLARTMTHSGQNAYLYLFTYAEKGKRAKLGAYHGEELYFLSNTYPTDWDHDGDDERLGQAIRAYWVQFAKTGNPNSIGLPEWPAYDTRKDQYLELGRSVALRQVPERVQVLGQIMEKVVADATGSAAPVRSN